jgi:F420-non-reducing hydrogenase iron-sulfur subunit
MFILKSMLKNIGLEDKRLRMTFVSASEGAKWAKVVEDVVKTVHELGPNPITQLTK